MGEEDGMDLHNESYLLGCNYWASHAGTHMWRQWDEGVVEKDFAQLAEMGITTLRVFPIWSDFQPVSMLHAGGGMDYEMVHDENFIDNPLNPEQLINPECFAHFDRLLEMAQSHGMRLIVGLITGWMSGRQFYPPMLEGKNLLTDPAAMYLELKFIDYFVTRYKQHPAIIAWNPGNECNTLGNVNSHEQAWLWLSSIVNAIRKNDSSRPVIAGMHGLTATGIWRIADVADCCDYLTTHPYPLFTPHCDHDFLTSMRSVLHSTTESLFYADLGNKPCIVEEIGSLSPMLGDQDTVALYAKNVLFSTWAHGINGLLWWCAYDQLSLDHAPYQWWGCERELGLIQENGMPKKLTDSIRQFRAFLNAFPYAQLPKRQQDAVCLLSQDQDQWGVAYSAFILAKQAGIDISFAYENQPLQDKPLYILPSVKGLAVIKKRYFDRLLNKVRAGASLLITSDGGLLPGFEELCGVVSKGRQSSVSQSVLMSNIALPRLGFQSMRLEATTAKVLAADEYGCPVFTVNTYGSGKVYFLDMPLENALCDKNGICDEVAPPYYEFYRMAAASVLRTRVQKNCPWIGLTEHSLSETETLVLAINYSAQTVSDAITLPEGWSVDRVLHGNLKQELISIEPADICIFVLKRL